jgi:hypothetical protein
LLRVSWLRLSHFSVWSLVSWQSFR